MNPRYRSLVTCIILSIVTCGIYAIYWMYCIAQDIHSSGAPDAPAASPGMVILLEFVTCGIYGFYLMYKWGKAIQQMYQVRGWNGEDRGVLYIVLRIFGLEIVNFALIQDDLNRMSTLPPPPTNPWGNGGYSGPGYSQPYGQQPYNAQGYTQPQQAYAEPQAQAYTQPQPDAAAPYSAQPQAGAPYGTEPQPGYTVPPQPYTGPEVGNPDPPPNSPYNP